MRLFFALTFDDETKSELAAYQDLICNQGMEGHNTRKENFHLTLAFIGECTEKDKEALVNLLHQLNSRCDSLHVDRIGLFRQKRSQLLWLGIAHNHALTRLKKALNSALLTQNFVVESRDFIPHITLCRHATGGEQLKNMLITPKQVRVYSVALMESMYRGNKLVYQIVDEVVQQR